ncbi:MAG: pYEATS domain-containing protein [Candidatus Micrarchaeaceae archaeon]
METFAKLIDSVASFAWPVVILIVAYFLKDYIFGILSALKRQLESGASVKFKDIEFRGINVADFRNRQDAVYSREAVSADVARSRHDRYTKSRNLFLVHQVRLTGKLHEHNHLPTCEIVIYLVGHKSYGLLNDVKEVAYYFGEKFARTISEYGAYYKVRNGNDGFAVRLTACGPTLCVAKVRFHNSEEATLTRYLDFEGTGYQYKEIPGEK